MASFHSSSLMENRYSYLLKPGARYDSSEDDDNNGRESQEYATFLRDKERKAARDGFVDSQKLQHNYISQASDSKEKKGKEKKEKPLTVVDLLAKKEKDQQSYNKRLKSIEDHMWQHKQDEREMKRVEGDIIKTQREVRRSLRDYENAITRKRLAEEKKQTQQLEHYTVVQTQQLHKKEDLTKQRIETSLSNDQTRKDHNRKVQLTTSQLARQYHTKMSELDMKRTELSRLSQDFESRLRRKEEEQFRLKQELAELAISLNMEAQKGRSEEHSYKKDQKKQKHERLDEDRKTQQTMDADVGRKETFAKTAEQSRRKMSADLTLTRAHLQLKQREEQRHRKDVNNQLRDNMSVQKQLNEAAVQAEMDHKNRQIDRKIQEHNQRRHLLASQSHRHRKENADQHEQQFSVKFQKRFTDQQRREHEDHLKHFQRSVTKGEEIEYNLYNTVKNTEYDRQKREQNVKRLQRELQQVQKENAQKIKSEMLDAAKQQEELKQKLALEQAKLNKVHAKREDSYLVLQKHRQQLRGDKYLLAEHEREHERLTRVGQKTESIS